PRPPESRDEGEAPARIARSPGARRLPALKSFPDSYGAERASGRGASPPDNAPLLPATRPLQKARSQDRYGHRQNEGQPAEPADTGRLLLPASHVFPRTRHSYTGPERTLAPSAQRLRTPPPLPQSEQVAPKDKHDRSGTRRCWGRSGALHRNGSARPPSFLFPSGQWQDSRGSWRNRD